ncbi:MAG: alkaline phosphatase [Desulfobulbaceae bacterium]|nr:alkaline phosphatase [Desulfobulbaceae bacterium]
MQQKFRTSLLILAFLALPPGAGWARDASAPSGKIKNIILLIPDGLSVTATTLARWYSGENLAMDELAAGLVRTYSSDAVIADSAPSGGAYATGWKSQTGNIATSGEVYSMPGAKNPDESHSLRPLGTILEAARLAGKATGLVVTSEFMHATPADFAAHDPSREAYENLSEQMLYNNLTVLLGGGNKELNKTRKDKENLKEIARSRGYSFVDNPEALNSFKGDKLFGVFGKRAESRAMSYDLDRDPVKEPTLAEMASKALEVLARNRDGFFVMIEGSKIDWAAHANDPVGVISDLLAFDKAVKVALDFAKKDQNTLLIVVPDHGNSGLTIGNSSTNSGYDKLPLAAVLDPLKKAKVTGEGLEALLSSDRNNTTAIRQSLADNYGIADPTDAELEAIAKAEVDKMNRIVGPMLGARAKLGYTTNGHTGEDVVLYDYDPRGARLTGLVDNTEIARYMAQAIGVDLAQTTDRLFVDAAAAFGAKGASCSDIDTRATENPVLVVVAKDGKTTLEIPRNKSIAFRNGQPVDSEGVAVLSNQKWYVARSLVDLLN